MPRLYDGTKSSAATLFISGYPCAERTEFEKSVTSAINNVFMIGNGVAPEAFVMGANPPALPGLGQVGGLTMQLIDLESHPDDELSDIIDKIVIAANQRPELQGVSTSFSVISPSYRYEPDQKKIEMLGVNLADVYFRGEVDMLKFMYVRRANGQFVSLDSLISYKLNVPKVFLRGNSKYRTKNFRQR